MAANSTQVRWALTGDEIWVSTPYNEEFVADIKVKFLRGEYRWIPSRRVWAFQVAAKARVHSLVAAHFAISLDEPENSTAEHEARKESAAMEEMRQEIIRLTREVDDAKLTAANNRQNIRENLRMRAQVQELQRKNARLARELTSARLSSQFSGFGRGFGGNGTSLDDLFATDFGKGVWKALAGALHPDRHGNSAEATELFQKVEKAWADSQKGKR